MITPRLRGVVAVAATYVYFLLFAQYGFLRLLEQRLDDAAGLKGVMAAMGLTGLVTSLATGRLLARRPSGKLLRLGFASACVTAMLAPLGHSPAYFVGLAAAIGAATALTTVCLAADLRQWLGSSRVGLGIGLGTGLAYLVCNVPAIFAGPPAAQAMVSAIAAGLGWLVVSKPATQDSHAEPLRAWKASDFGGVGLATVVAGFLALVWLDSAAFTIVQRTPELQELTWQGAARGWLLGAVHFAAAVGAGVALDRGRSRSLMLLTFALFVVAFELLAGAGAGSPFAAPLYLTGVSIYSVALVAYPSARPDGPRLVPARWRAALLYGVAGWLGSALGIGMAESLNAIPRGFVVVSGTVLAGGWLFSAMSSSTPSGRALRAHRVTLFVGLIGVAVYGAMPPAAPVADGSSAAVASVADADAAAIERGRDVYVSEGCINCHSQYVRPDNDDVARWGPPDPEAGHARPVLIGNRRQGPDLLNVGLRYNAEWQRQHLLDPRAMSPGSRMPSYAYLFRDGDRRGEDLVAYLGSLGQRTTHLRAQATPDPE